MPCLYSKGASSARTVLERRVLTLAQVLSGAGRYTLNLERGSVFLFRVVAVP